MMHNYEFKTVVKLTSTDTPGTPALAPRLNHLALNRLAQKRPAPPTPP